MNFKSWLSMGTITALSFSAVGGMAQETPPPTDPPKQEEQDPDEEIIPVKWNEITVGYSTFKSNQGLSRYAQPSEGFNLHELKLFTPGTEKTPSAWLVMRGLAPQDNYIAGYIALNRGNTVLRGARGQHKYDEFDWHSKDRSEDNVTEITLDHAFAPNFGGYAIYRATERDARYTAPRDAEHMRTRQFAGGVGGKVLGGNLDVNYSDRRSFDDTGVQPGTLQQTVSAGYSRDFGSLFSLEGTAASTKIQQAGLANSFVRSYALAGAWDLAPSTGLQFHLGRQDLDLNNVQNAHIRKRLLTSIRLQHRFPGWNLQFGYKHRETERIRADQSFIDVPKSNEYDARLSGSLGPARVTLRGSWEDLRETAVMNTPDTRQLLWDDRAMFQAKLDGGNDVFAAYGTYTYRFQQNKQRGVDIRWNNLVLGGSYVFNPAWNAYIEFAADNFAVSGGTESGQSLDFYFPNSRSLAFGVNWSQDPRMSASANLNYYESGDVRGTQLTLSLRRRLSEDHDLELVVAPWRHEDRLYNLTGYRTTFASLRYTVRF
jgi:hypothetical protein